MVPVKYLGASVFGVNVAPGHATSYEVNSKVRYLQDRPEMRCSLANLEKIDECLMTYLDKNMNCKLPWRSENNWNKEYESKYPVPVYHVRVDMVFVRQMIVSLHVLIAKKVVQYL